MNEVTRPHAAAVFRVAQAYCVELRPFESPETLVVWLLDYTAHPQADEDSVLRRLRSQYAQGEEKALWMSLVALGLWPNLEWVFCRVRRHAKTDPEAASEIWSALEDVLENEKFWQEASIAKRLRYRIWPKAVRSTHADRAEHKRLDKAIARCPEYRVVENAGFPFQSKPGDKGDYGSSRDELCAIASRLVKEFGLTARDADLVVRHAVEGISLVDLATHCAASYETIRQRYSRACRRLRKNLPTFAKNNVTLSILQERGLVKDDEGSAASVPDCTLLH